MRKISTAIFNDKMLLKEVILSNKGFRLFLAECFSFAANELSNGRKLASRAKLSFKKFKNNKLESFFNNYPLLQTPAPQPIYVEFYMKGKDMLSKYTYLSSMTPERKKLSEDTFFNDLKQQYEKAGRGKNSPLTNRQLKDSYESYQEDARSIEDDVTRNAFLIDSENFEVIPDKIFTYLIDAYDTENAFKEVEKIFRQGAKFYATTNGSDIFTPDTSGLETKKWKSTDVVWKMAINKGFYGYGDKKISEIKDLIDFEENSLMKFKSFYENLSAYKPEKALSFATEEATLKEKVEEKAPILKLVESDKVISTKGIYQIIREKTSSIIKDYGSSLDSHTYEYTISQDEKTITYRFGLYYSKVSELKERILSSFQRKQWSGLFSISINYIEELKDSYIFDVSLTAIKGYKFHPYKSKDPVDIETKSDSSSVPISTGDKVEIPEDQLIPPAELPIDKKIEFVLKHNPRQATCQVCQGEFNLTKKGLIQTHGYIFGWGKELGKSEGSDCEGSGSLPSQFSKDQTIFEISRLSQLVYKMEKSPSSFSDKEKDNLYSLKNQLSRLELTEKNWKFAYYDPNNTMWIGTKYPVGLSNDDYIETEGTKETSEAILKLGNFKLIFVSEINIEELLRIRDSFEKAIDLIKKSPLKKFKNSLRGRVFVGKTEDLKRRMIIQGYTSREALAEYNIKRGYISFFTDDYLAKLTKHERAADVIHEFGHKFHNEDLPDFYGNKEIKDLYNLDKSDSCIKSSLPSKGDLLSDFTLPGNVRISSLSDFVCIGFKGKKGEGAKYIFENPKTKEQKIVEEDYFVSTIKCPSAYGGESILEWFAEMCVLVTGNVARVSNEAIAKKFIKIVNNL